MVGIRPSVQSASKCHLLKSSKQGTRLAACLFHIHPHYLLLRKLELNSTGTAAHYHLLERSGGYANGTIWRDPVLAQILIPQWVQANRAYSGSIQCLAVSDEHLSVWTDGGIWWRSLSDMVSSVARVSTGLPGWFRLDQNCPNPSDPATTLFKSRGVSWGMSQG